MSKEASDGKNQNKKTKAFPWIMPKEKPTDRPISEAMKRLYDDYGPYGDRYNEFFSNFKYTKINGIGSEEGVTRRDPSKVIRVNGVYYVYYTLRKTKYKPVGVDKCDDERPAVDWDLSDIGYATSTDGINWTERGIAVHRPPKGTIGDRSLATPDILCANGKYYLIYQAYTGRFGEEAYKIANQIIEKYPGIEVERIMYDYCVASMAWADSPDGPWHRTDKAILAPGDFDEWDNGCIHDPYFIKFKGKYLIYYKSDSIVQNKTTLRTSKHGVAMADNPMGPYVKSEYNPILLSGHETFYYPYKNGIVSIATFDGPEKNTAQFSEDGINFTIKAHLRLPPVAAGPFCPDAFADNGDAQGISWGLCHMRYGGKRSGMYLARFDCSLTQDNVYPELKVNRHINNENTYFQPNTTASRESLKKYLDAMKQRDFDTID